MRPTDASRTSARDQATATRQLPGTTMPHLNLGDRRGDLPPGGVALVPGADLPIVRQSRRPETLARSSGKRSDLSVHLGIWARLLPEPDNRHDEWAVTVFVADTRVGYLARGKSATLCSWTASPADARDSMRMMPAGSRSSSPPCRRVRSTP
jgi:hypothetical protein